MTYLVRGLYSCTTCIVGLLDRVRRWLDLVSDISSRDEAGKAARCEKHPSEAWQPRMCSDELETIPSALLKQIILLSNSNK